MNFETATEQKLANKRNEVAALKMILKEALEWIENPHGQSYIRDLMRKHNIKIKGE